MSDKLKIYNTLTRSEEVFKPVKKSELKVYVCGPTVSDVPHLGHARSQISFDVLRRYLKFLGYKVKFVSNITDIEDKIINKAKELGENIESLTKRNEKAHVEDYSAINISAPDVRPHATEYVKEMIELIKKLEENGKIYMIRNDGVYFDISKFKDYGKLSHQNVGDLKVGARVKANEEKKNKEDFVLWKFSKTGEPKEVIWNSPWGKGRPGWHIECSAMSEKILGLPLDIHGGGQDLIFPHHEDEIAQTEGAFEKKFANYWMHNGMVNFDNVKMSKSLGNFKTIRDLLKLYKGEIIRYFIVSTHYRAPIDFTYQGLDSAKNSYERLKNIISETNDDGKKANKKYIEEFREAMNQDLNTPKALQVLWNLVRDKKAEGKIKTIKKIDSVFGLNLLEKEKIEISKEVIELADKRERFRQKKDWKKADELRDEIKKLGFTIEDKEKGYVLKKND